MKRLAGTICPAQTLKLGRVEKSTFKNLFRNPRLSLSIWGHLLKYVESSLIFLPDSTYFLLTYILSLPTKEDSTSSITI